MTVIYSCPHRHVRTFIAFIGVLPRTVRTKQMEILNGYWLVPFRSPALCTKASRSLGCRAWPQPPTAIYRRLHLEWREEDRENERVSDFHNYYSMRGRDSRALGAGPGRYFQLDNWNCGQLEPMSSLR